MNLDKLREGYLWAPNGDYAAEFVGLYHRISEMANSNIGIVGGKGEVLYLAARYGPGEGCIVEVGSGFGRSTCYLAGGSKHGGREQVWTIDPHEEYGSGEGFLNLVVHLGLADYVRPLFCTSKQARRGWDGSPIRLLYIDGDHSYEGVKTDVECWAPLVLEGCPIIFDDFKNIRAVNALVKQFVKQFDRHLFGTRNLVWVV